MKRIGLIAVLAALAAASAHAQQVFEPAVPRVLPDTRVEPVGELGAPPQSAAPQLVMSPRHYNDADARRCLQFTSNAQIHRCAERYRPHGAAARVVKTSVRTNSPSPASRATAADLGKPDMSKAAEPAKPVDTAKPAAAAKPAEVAKAPPAEKSGEQKKWTEDAKAMLKQRGERLTNRLNEEK